MKSGKKGEPRKAGRRASMTLFWLICTILTMVMFNQALCLSSYIRSANFFFFQTGIDTETDAGTGFRNSSSLFFLEI
jgi:hypothetical protein